MMMDFGYILKSPDQVTDSCKQLISSLHHIFYMMTPSYLVSYPIAGLVL